MALRFTSKHLAQSLRNLKSHGAVRRLIMQQNSCINNGFSLNQNHDVANWRNTRKSAKQSLLNNTSSFQDTMNNSDELNMQPVIDETNINLFWKYIIERHNVYKKRSKNKAGPWTEDKILSQWRFTNVFRENDPGTEYVIKQIIPKFENDFINLLFNIIIYRIYNKINTMNNIGFQDIETFNKTNLEIDLRKIIKNKQKVFTNAFIVTSFSFIDPNNNYDKIGRTCILFEKIRKIMPDLTKNILKQKNSENTYKALLKLPGIGKFLAYQICVDLGYWNEEIFDENEYVVAGPGAINGIKRIFKDKKNLNYNECIKYLCKIQKKGFLTNGYDLETLFDDRKQKYLNLMAMENCLCEISKYLKTYYNEGRPRNRFILKTLHP